MAFLEKIKNEVLSHKCEFIFLSVPGNHDIDYDKLGLNKDMSKEVYQQKYDGITEEKYIYSLNSYFDSLNLIENNCFKKDKNVDRLIFDLDKNFKISFALINTASYSALKKIDKEQHKISSSKLNSLMFSDSSFQITIMHHSKEWFDDSTQHEMTKILDKYTDLLFVGHEHDPENVDMKSESKSLLINNRGGKFDPTDVENMSFYSYEIDTSLMSCKESFYKMTISDKRQFFQKSNNKTYNLEGLRNGNKKISRLVEEKFDILDVCGHKTSINNLFVFPRIVGDDEIINFHDFQEVINEEKIIQITGSGETGKTFLAKYLFLKINDIDDEFCIYVQGRDIPRNNKHESFINSLIDEQMNSGYFRQCFEKSDASKKTLIIDDFDYCKSDKNEFISIAKNIFGKIVFLTSYVFEKYHYRVENSNKIKQFKIGFYTKIQREEMIGNICKIRNVAADDRSVIISTINSMATYSSLEELCNPFYIYLLTNNLIDHDRVHSVNEKTTFSETFIFSLQKMLQRGGTNYTLDEKMLILSILSYHLFENKIFEFDDEDFIKIKKPLLDKHSIRLDIYSFVNDMVETKVFIKSEESQKYRFAKNSFLAFFVAERIRTKRIHNDINFLMENIHHGIYGDILLFIVYESADLTLFEKIENEITSMWSGCVKIDFECPNNPIIQKYQGGLEAVLENKKSIEKRLDKNENKSVTDLKTKEENAFVTSEKFSPDECKIIRTMKLIEILGKAVSSFRIQIENDERTKMIELIKETSFKILYKIFEISMEKMDEMERDFKKKIENEPKLKTISFMDVVDILFDSITTNSLNFLTGVCNIFVSKNSISCLDGAIDSNNKNDLLFKDIALERYGQIDKYVPFITTNYSNNSESIKYMMRRVTGLFLVYHPSIDEKNLNKICAAQQLDKQKVLNVLSQKKGISNNLLEAKKESSIRQDDRK